MTDGSSNITIHGGEMPEIKVLNDTDKAPKQHVSVYDSKDYLRLGMATPLGERAILGSVGETNSEGEDSNHSEFEIPYKMLLSYDSKMTGSDCGSLSPANKSLER